jgi:hypothetical protein
MKPPALEPLELLLEIDGVKIWATKGGHYVKFTSDLDICNDGSGPAYGDPHHQSETAYYSGGKAHHKYLNADVDHYIVIPPQVRSMVPPVVMGSQGWLTDTETGISHAAVTGEIGPDYTSGEAAYCLAKFINRNITHNSGDKTRHYVYELWPGMAAVVGNFTYKLQPA